MKHLKTVNEYYKGKNQTIGFRYSEPEQENVLSTLFFSNLSDEEINDILEKELSKNIDDFDYDVREFAQPGDKQYENFKLNFDPNIFNENNVLFEIVIKLKTYHEDEILSLSIELMSAENGLLFVPTARLNDEVFDPMKKHRASKKIGY